MPVLERAHESSQDYDGREILVERKPDEKGSWKKAAASWKASAREGVGAEKGTSHTDLGPKEQIKTNWA